MSQLSPSMRNDDRDFETNKLESTKHISSEQQAMNELKELFDLFDTDKDGFISFVDLKNVLVSLCEYESDHGIEDMMKKMLSIESQTEEYLENDKNIDIRTQLIDYNRFAQTFLFYHMNEDFVREDDEVLTGLTNSPTTAAMFSNSYSTGSRVYVVPHTSSTRRSFSTTPTSSKPISRRSNIRASNISRSKRCESLTSAYEISELIDSDDDEDRDDISDDEDMYQGEEQTVEQLTLDEFENRQVFRVLDIDGNGSITIGELKDLLLRYCPCDIADELDEDRLIDMLNVVDINSDGKVQYDEFLKLIENKKREEE